MAELHYADTARALLDQQLVSLTDAKAAQQETDTRDGYYLLRLHAIATNLQARDTQAFLTADQLRQVVDEVAALVEGLREDGFELYLHGVDADILDVLKGAQRQRQVRGTIDEGALNRASRGLRALYVAIERASLTTDTERAPATLSVRATTTRLRAMAQWLDDHDAKANTPQPPHWTDAEAAELVGFGKEARAMREAFLATNATTSGLAPVLNQLGLLHERFRTEDRVRALRPVELRAAAVQLRDTATLVTQLDGAGLVQDDDQLKRWIEFANTDLMERAAREDVLELPVRTVVDRFLLTWHGIALELASPDPWKPATEATRAQWNEWWTIVLAVATNVWRVFTQADRLMYVGIGLVVAALFVFFLGVSG